MNDTINIYEKLKSKYTAAEREAIQFLVIDLFCGAGGTTTGVENARNEKGQKLAITIACVNHDPYAIESHQTNWPDALHFIEDVRNLDPIILANHAKEMLKLFPNARILLWASLECTNFSKAKGGLPRDGDSRTLANDLFRYIEAINPDYIMIENVEEFLSWGPLDKNGKPVSRKNGIDFQKWYNQVMTYGYAFKYDLLNAANYGGYSSRKRLFIIFSKAGLPNRFPKATHSKKPTQDMFGGLKPWKPVREVLDFEDEGESIFGRPTRGKKDLVERTLQRIYAGLKKYVANGEPVFLAQKNGGNPASKIISIQRPARTVTTTDQHQLVQSSFLSKAYSGDPASKNISIEQPAGSITCKDHHQLIQSNFLVKYMSNNAKTGINAGADITKPSPTLTTQNRLGLCSCNFLTHYYGNGHNTSINSPASTISTKDRIGKIQADFWLDKQYSGAHNHQSVDSPTGAITTNNHYALVEAKKQHFMVNPQYGNGGSSVDKPCFTLIARMDKMPPYLICTESGQLAIKINATDSPTLVLIKEFMAYYGIIDIKMRMLKVKELKLITGFEEDYVLVGGKTRAKKFIGNAVMPIMAQKLIEANAIAA